MSGPVIVLLMWTCHLVAFTCACPVLTSATCRAVVPPRCGRISHQTATHQSSPRYFLKMTRGWHVWQDLRHFCNRNWRVSAEPLHRFGLNPLHDCPSLQFASRLRSHASHLLRISSNDVHCGRGRKPNGEAQRFQWTAQSLVYRKGYETCGLHEYEAFLVRKSSLWVCFSL